MTIEQLAICIYGLDDSFYVECFISGLKETIRAYVRMKQPTTCMEVCEHTL